jgi:tetratricopeptide (TPR) repeat protein
MKVLLSMSERNLRLTAPRYSFPRGHALRFEWLVLLAYTRTSQSVDGGWVSIEDIQKLPLWRGKTKQHVGTNVARYLQDLERDEIKLVEAKTQWRGPYRLRVLPKDITFDIPILDVAARLGMVRTKPVNRRRLLEFTEKYAKAISLYWEGRLTVDPRAKKRREENALNKLLELTRNPALDARLRLMATLAFVRILDRLGRFSGAAMTLDDCERLATRVRDPAVAAAFHLANAWRYYQAGNDLDFGRHLLQAQELSTQTMDANLRAAHLSTQGLYFSAKGKYQNALTHLVKALDVRLPTENFDAIQAACFNIGNTIHRMGERYYAEAERWLTLCVSICEWMRLGRYDAMSEVMLAKIALESGNPKGYEKWINRAEIVAQQASNRSNQMWCHVIRAFYSQRFNEPQNAIQHLVTARKMYTGTSDYDLATTEKYLQRKFPEFWDEVVKRSS